MAPTISLSQLTYTSAGLLSNPPNRLDGRDLLQFRPIEIVSGIAEQSAGSARCRLGDQTCCSVVISSEIVQEEYLVGGNGKLIECFIELHQSIPQSVNLSTLLINLQKLLDQFFTQQKSSSTFDQSQLIILRNTNVPHQPARAWKLTIDVTLLDVSGGNIADAVFASTFAALRDVRLPKTNAIGFDINSMGLNQNDSTTQGEEDSSSQKVDIFDVRGSLNRTRGAGRQSDKMATITNKQNQQTSIPISLDSIQKAKIGVDFEIKDSGDELKGLEGINSFPIGLTLNILPKSILLDATQTEEACLPFTRRIFLLYNSVSEEIVGMQMLPASFETGSNRLGEERIQSTKVGGTEQSILGTCDLDTIKSSIREGQKYAKALYSAIESQINPTTETKMEIV